MKITLSVSVLLLSALLLPATDYEFSGYFESRLFLVENPGLPWRPFSEKVTTGAYNRLRLSLKVAPADKLKVNLALDLFSFHGFPGLLTASAVPAGSAEYNGYRVEPDRLYLDVYLKHLDISIGKQRLALGVSQVWTPLDVFNRVNLFEPKEEKPGTNALKIYLPLGASSSLTGIYSPAGDFSTANSALRWQSRLARIDAGFTFIRRGEINSSILGLDLRGENLVGWWLEYAHFISPGRRNNKLVLGWDYSFPLGRGLYWLNEFFFDDSGGRSVGEYDIPGLQQGLRFTLGRVYLFSMLRCTLDDFRSISLSYIANWGDGSYIINPMLSWDLMQNLNLSAGLYLPCGNRLGEFNRQRRNVLFIWLKASF